MLVLVIKILLGVFAAAIAVLSITDYKTLSDTPQGVPWYRRLTSVGFAKLIIAGCTLLLFGVNETFTYQAGNRAREEADTRAEELKTTLDNTEGQLFETRKALDASVKSIRELASTNRFLVRSLDDFRKPIGAITVPASSIASSYHELTLLGRPYVPKDGDFIQWSFVCHMGAVPQLPPHDTSPQCAGIAYGRLMADGRSVPLQDKSGAIRAPSTRSSNAVMSYRSTAEGDFGCEQVANALRERQCELRIEVQREARWGYRELDPNADKDASFIESEACRRYEAITKGNCDDLLRK